MVCPGDSGGPMICYGYQYGIASHGYNFKNWHSKFVCGSSDIQVKHLFVYPYLNWISETMNNSIYELNNANLNTASYIKLICTMTITMHLYIFL